MGSSESHLTKNCRDCGEEKPLDDFPPNESGRLGRASYCRPCINVRHDRYREAKRTSPRTRHRNAEPPRARTVKWCPDCGQEKPVSDFGRNKSSRDGFTGYCRPCHNRRVRDSRMRTHGGSRSYHLKARYGITAAEYDAMVEAQGGVCAMCEERAPEHVDHDHLTGRIRGVLCSCCNQALGNLRDSVDLARRAVDYLERTTWQKRQVCTGVYRLTSPRSAAAPSRSSSALQHLISSRRG